MCTISWLISYGVTNSTCCPKFRLILILGVVLCEDYKAVQGGVMDIRNMLVQVPQP